jgi:hypothetical protein
MPGKGRPFQAGNDANPHGRRGKDSASAAVRQAKREVERRWIEDVTQAARERTDKALNTLENALDDAKCPWSAKITAAEAILNRGWGKAKETIAAEHRLTLEDLVLGSMRVEEERERANAAAQGDTVTLSKPN